MAQVLGRRSGERAAAAAGAAALHGLLALALIAGFSVRLAADAESELKLFDVAGPPPPPEESRPADTQSDQSGRPSPPDLEAAPAPVVAMPSPLPPRSPVPAADEPSPVPPGRDASAGNAEVPGTGSGTAGAGVGTGAGGEGSGTGGGARRAERIGGAISGATDYPPAARRAGIEGSVRVRYTVGTDGRVRACRITRSSGSTELDSTTCRLAEQRFRYRPARDSSGRPVPETVSRTFDWLLPGRR